MGQNDVESKAGVVICAHVGDSRMVICHQQKALGVVRSVSGSFSDLFGCGGEVLFETVDHDIDDIAECRHLVLLNREVPLVFVRGACTRPNGGSGGRGGCGRPCSLAVCGTAHLSC